MKNDHMRGLCDQGGKWRSPWKTQCLSGQNGEKEHRGPNPKSGNYIFTLWKKLHREMGGSSPLGEKEGSKIERDRYKYIYYIYLYLYRGSKNEGTESVPSFPLDGGNHV